MAHKAITNSGRLDDISATRSQAARRGVRAQWPCLGEGVELGRLYSRSSKASAIRSLTSRWPLSAT
jgi:hypothetical protein